MIVLVVLPMETPIRNLARAERRARLSIIGILLLAPIPRRTIVAVRMVSALTAPVKKLKRLINMK